MAKAKKLPSGKWRVQAYSHTDSEGKIHRVSITGDTKKEAEYMAAQYSLDKGKTKPRAKVSKTFGEALDDYIKIKEPVLSPRTIADYRRIRKNDIQGIMDVKIYDITQDLIQDTINKDSKIHSPKTVRNSHGLISAVLKRERPEFALNTTLPKKVRPNLYVPTDDDIQAVLREAEGGPLELPILLAAFGPMRRGEICALDASDIDGNVVHVRRNTVIDENREWIIKEPKSFAGDRFIAFPVFIAGKWQGINGRITQLTPDMITNRFSRLLKRAGVPHFRFHDLRHYCASIQHALGVPDAYIMKRGGWSSDSVLKSVYRHAMDDKEKNMADLANEHFEKLHTELHME